MRRLAIICVLALISCGGGRPPHSETPGTSPDEGNDGGNTEEKGCWDEEPCPSSSDWLCKPPGSAHTSGKTPEIASPVGPIPDPCETDAECEPVNEICEEGLCRPAPCSTSEDCDGYCIGGACWSEPGFCDNLLLP